MRECDPGESAPRLQEPQVQGAGAAVPRLGRVRGVQDAGGRLRGHHLQPDLPEDHRGRGGQRPHRHEAHRHVSAHHEV